MDLAYPLVPFAAWLMAGSTKFAINSAKIGRPALDQIGYGGLPSNHSAIVTSAAVLIALREGLDDPAVAVAVAVAFVVMLDANSLRRHVGRHAAAINGLEQRADQPQLRERMGHSRVEIAAGIAVGAVAAVVVDLVFDYLL